MAKSVRYSCAQGQMPLWTNIGIFVVINAVTIMIISGIDANRVTNPNITRVPHKISNVPVKYAQNAGLVKPIVKKRLVPKRSGNKYF